jgi:ClpP class serine protease
MTRDAPTAAGRTRAPIAWAILRIGGRLFWMALALVVLFELWAPSRVVADRERLLDAFQAARQSRAIAMIHRQEAFNPFGVPVARYIDIEDSESVLRAIRETPDDQPIDFILHTPGGLVLAAEQIAHALISRKGKVTVFVPHYAMSGGTLIALAADEIVMDPNAVLGPVDPQIDDLPAASIVKLVTLKPIAQIGDEMLVMADIAQKARIQVVSFVSEVLLKHLPRERAIGLATALADGRWTHDFPITVEAARTLGLSVSTNMPPVLYDLMELYPQADQGRPTVLSVPLRREPIVGPAASSPDNVK